MKTLLILLLVILLSCSRQGMTLDNEPEISFDINGTHYSHTGEQSAANGSVGVFAAKSAGVPGGISTFYSFSGYENTGNIIQIIIITPNDTLKTTNYNQGITLNLKAAGDQYIFTQATVIITSYQNGVVNGNFTGSASKVVSINPSILTPVTFSSGVIKNVKVTY